MTSNPTRWQQRLENLQKAHARFTSACSQENYSDLELAGLIQTFEFTFELLWKALKDLLEYEGYTDVASPRASIRKSLTAEYVNAQVCETLLEMLNKRNLLTHTYNDALAQEAKKLIKQDFQPAINQAVNFLQQKAGDNRG